MCSLPALRPNNHESSLNSSYFKLYLSKGERGGQSDSTSGVLSNLTFDYKEMMKVCKKFKVKTGPMYETSHGKVK